MGSWKQARAELAWWAKQASDRFRSGKFNMKPVTPGSKEAQSRQELQQYIIEVVNAR
jgi:hypothetical protein